jgi:hypothetical protein
VEITYLFKKSMMLLITVEALGWWSWRWSHCDNFLEVVVVAQEVLMLISNCAKFGRHCMLGERGVVSEPVPVVLE